MPIGEQDPAPPPPPPRPEVALCFALSVDGRIAPPGGGAGFTSRRDRRHLHERRAWADVVLIGAATVAAEDPPASVMDADLRAAREAEGRPPEPRFCIVSGRASVPPTARALTAPEGGPSPLVLVGDDAPADRVDALAATGAEVRRAGGAGLIDLTAALAALHRDGVRRVLCEGGGALNAAMLAADLVDELHVTLAPCLLGSGPGAVGPVEGALLGRRGLELVSHEAHEGELTLRYRVRREDIGPPPAD